MMPLHMSIHSVTKLREALHILESQGYGECPVIIPYPYYYGEPRKGSQGFTTTVDIRVKEDWVPHKDLGSNKVVCAALITP